MSFIRYNRGLQSALLQHSLKAVQRANIRHRHAIAANSARLVNSSSLYNPHLHRNNAALATSRTPFRSFSISPRAFDVAKAAQPRLVWIDAPAEPALPPPVDVPLDAVPANLNALGEVSFSALGLGGTSPIGLLQSGLEYVHVAADLPWWGTIALVSVILRVALTPAVIAAHKNSTPITNALPELHKIHDNIANARREKNKFAVSQYKRDRIMLLNKCGYHPLLNGLMPILTVQTLVTYMVSVSYMIDAPVEELQSGGLLWFSDLAVMDPYCVLPLVSCGTYWLMDRLQSDGYVVTGDYRSKEMYFYVIKPFVALTFVLYLPAAMNLIWASFNLAGLVQGLFLRVPAIRRALKMPQLKWHAPPAAVNVHLKTAPAKQTFTTKK